MCDATPSSIFSVVQGSATVGKTRQCNHVHKQTRLQSAGALICETFFTIQVQGEKSSSFMQIISTRVAVRSSQIALLAVNTCGFVRDNFLPPLKLTVSIFGQLFIYTNRNKDGTAILIESFWFVFDVYRSYCQATVYFLVSFLEGLLDMVTLIYDLNLTHVAWAHQVQHLLYLLLQFNLLVA